LGHEGPVEDAGSAREEQRLLQPVLDLVQEGRTNVPQGDFLGYQIDRY
jgi:hypothetical protein